jgi:redox-regulated HSP33 family molecular chaperone
MKEDYLLIGVDLKDQFAVRFLSLGHALETSLELHKPGSDLARLYAEFVLGSVLLGSRMDEQQATLYKLKFEDPKLTINCEVAPQGAFRSAIFPPENKDDELKKAPHQLCIVLLKQKDDVYESYIEVDSKDVSENFQNYLNKSVQTDAIIWVHVDLDNLKNSFGVWVERLPTTTQEVWDQWSQALKQKDHFLKSFSKTDDPDKILKNLFLEPIRILAVTKPSLLCSCNKERIIGALKLLPEADLVEIFMDNKGVETVCDYCHKVWSIEDAEIQAILKMKSILH